MRPFGSLRMTENHRTFINFLAFSTNRLGRLEYQQVLKNLHFPVDWTVYLVKMLRGSSSPSVPFVQVCFRGVALISCRELNGKAFLWAPSPYLQMSPSQMASWITHYNFKSCFILSFFFLFKKCSCVVSSSQPRTSGQSLLVLALPSFALAFQG